MIKARRSKLRLGDSRCCADVILSTNVHDQLKLSRFCRSNSSCPFAKYIKTAFHRNFSLEITCVVSNFCFDFPVAFGIFLCSHFLYLNFSDLQNSLSCLGLWKRMYYFAERFWFQSFFIRKNHRQEEGRSGMKLQIDCVSYNNQSFV